MNNTIVKAMTYCLVVFMSKLGRKRKKLFGIISSAKLERGNMKEK